MAAVTTDWGIRSILAPVLTRLLIYDINPVDLERVVASMENVELTHLGALEENWLSLWQKKKSRYIALAVEAESEQNRLTAGKLYKLAAQCSYAIFLINFAKSETKKQCYMEYASAYLKASSFFSTPVKRIELPFEADQKIYANLHLPEGTGPFPCTVILSGAGSCKEEMDILARPLVERGVAALVPDLPGVGESLYSSDIKCRWTDIQKAFGLIMDFALDHPKLDSEAIGTGGLCMGGGIAYRLTSARNDISWLATLFPLFIDVAVERAPQWMSRGKWYQNLVGDVPLEEYLKEMSLGKEDRVSCPYFFIHGKSDNWMEFDEAEELYRRSTGEKKLLAINDEPVYYNGVKVVHAMPVGEQMHWVKHIYADWIAGQVRKKERKSK